jgi:hypothetical protein
MAHKQAGWQPDCTEAMDAWTAGRSARHDASHRMPPAALRPSMQIHWLQGFDHQSQLGEMNERRAA